MASTASTPSTTSTLNVSQYSDDELFDMFHLDAATATQQDVTQHYQQAVSNLQQQQQPPIDQRQLQQTLAFLSNAHQYLLRKAIKTAQLQEDVLENTASFIHSSYTMKPVPLMNGTANSHAVQERRQIPYQMSFPSEYFPGIINPLNRRTVKKVVNIDTRFRENYYSSPSTNFHLTLPVQFNDIVTMQLNSVEIPTTYFTVNKQYGNNFFQLTVETTTDPDTPQSAYLTVNDGNYTPASLVQAINTELQVAGAPFDEVVFAVNAAPTPAAPTPTSQPAGTGQCLVGTTSSSIITSLSLLFAAESPYLLQPTSSTTTTSATFPNRYTPLPLSLGWILGFRNGEYAGNLNYVSEGIIDTAGPRYLFLVVEDHNTSVNNMFYSAFNSSVLNKSVLARISPMATTPAAIPTTGASPLTASPNLITQNNLTLVTSPREYFGPVKILNLNIQLLDEYGRVVNLNNMDYSFCLTLTQLYNM